MSVPIPNQSVPPTAAIPPIAPNSYQETTIAKSEGTTVLSSVPNQSAPPASAVQAPQVPSETHIQQIQLYPYIRFSLRLSVALLPLSSSPLPCRAMFPFQLSPFGQAGRLPLCLAVQYPTAYNNALSERTIPALSDWQSR